MTEDKVCHDIQRLRDPERLAILEADKAITLCLQGINVRTVLDVGTGSGVFAEAFASLGLQVTGIDVQKPMLEAARQHVPEAHFLLAASEDLPFVDDSFDLCFLGLILHEASSRLRAIQACHRVCALRTAVLEWPYVEEVVGPPLKHRLRTETVIRLATASGFSRLRTISLGHTVLSLLGK